MASLLTAAGACETRVASDQSFFFFFFFLLGENQVTKVCLPTYTIFAQIHPI